jgi:hypothetical protein
MMKIHSRLGICMMRAEIDMMTASAKLSQPVVANLNA